MREYIVPIYDDSPNHDEIFVGYIRENAQEIVRCGECKYCVPDMVGLACELNDEHIFNVAETDYCAWGERREDEVE